VPVFKPADAIAIKTSANAVRDGHARSEFDLARFGVVRAAGYAVLDRIHTFDRLGSEPHCRLYMSDLARAVGEWMSVSFNGPDLAHVYGSSLSAGI